MRSRGLLLAALVLSAVELHAQACVGLPVTVLNFSATSMHPTAQPNGTVREARVGLSVDNQFATFSISRDASLSNANRPVLYGGESFWNFHDGRSTWSVCPHIGFSFSRRIRDFSEGGDFKNQRGRAMIGISAGFEKALVRRVVLLPNAGLYYVGEATTRSVLIGGMKRHANEIQEGGLVTMGVGVLLAGSVTVQPSIALPLMMRGAPASGGVSMGWGFGRG